MVKRSAFSRWLILVALVAMGPLFQNCGRGFNGMLGGAGTDGLLPQPPGGDPVTHHLIYIAIGNCGGHKDIQAAIQMDDREHPLLIKQNCTDLQSPVALNPSDIVIGANVPGLIIWNGMIFDLQTNSVEQRLTEHYCQSAKSIVAIWTFANAPDKPNATITLSDATTGTLSVQASANGFSGSSASGDSTSLTLGNPSQLTYQIGPEAGTDTFTDCLTQPAP